MAVIFFYLSTVVLFLIEYFNKKLEDNLVADESFKL